VSYLEDLRKKYLETPDSVPPKLTKPGSGSFVSASPETLNNFRAWRWRLTFSDGRTLEVHYSPSASRDEVQADAARWHGLGATVEPLPDQDEPAEPGRELTHAEELAIRAWLKHINETDPDEIAEVLTQCRRDGEARRYFLQRAGEVKA
jgi:hypothetical protein